MLKNVYLFIYLFILGGGGENSFKKNFKLFLYGKNWNFFLISDLKLLVSRISGTNELFM